MPAIVSATSRPASGAGEAVANAGVDLGLGEQRLVGGTDAHHRAGGVHQLLGQLDHAPEPPEQLEHVGLEPGVDLGLGRRSR